MTVQFFAGVFRVNLASLHTLPWLKTEVEGLTRTTTPSGSIAYITDGSIDPITYTYRYRFATRNIASCIWITDNSSLLQVEAVANMVAPAHVLSHTDSYQGVQPYW